MFFWHPKISISELSHQHLHFTHTYFTLEANMRKIAAVLIVLVAISAIQFVLLRERPEEG